ncbi:flowering-promoting factor 1-like protein 3 [Tasmannia lanceolata]|uniref:flowering-promoting factor 1-like protein 3 n=1 Tax=Tasmannia lanceolata TaxID=3420 RepID=UPI004064466C
MSGVWVFKDGVMRRENPGAESGDGGQSSNARRKVLVHTPTDQVITSYALLEAKLAGLGWERYNGEPHLLQFHKQSSVHLISLPRDFSKFNSVHMYDIVVKTRNEFRVKEV